MRIQNMTALLLALALLLLPGCTPGEDDSPAAPESQEAAEVESEETDEQDQPADGIIFTDMTGREVVLDGPVQRVVALTAAECEIMYALGVQDRLVGRGEYCDYPAEALELPSVQSGENINVEEILALQPDAVFMSDMGHSAEQIAAIADTGVTVIVSKSSGIDDVYRLIVMMGKALDLEADAEALASYLSTSLSDLAQRVPGTAPKPTIYFEVSPLAYGLWAAGADTFMDEIAELLGLENCFGDVSGWKEISQEQVIARDPDYIVSITMYDGVGPDPVEEIRGREGWQNLTAVREGQVMLTDSDEISRPGPRLLDAAESLFQVIYGED